jgi:hypothetical protein
MTDKSDKGFSESRGPKKQKSKANKWINYKSAIAFGLVVILLVGGLEFYQYVGEANKREETIMKTELYIPSIEVMYWGDVDENGEPIEAEYKYSTEGFYRGQIMVIYGGSLNYEDKNNIRIIATYPNGTELIFPERYIRFERVACYDLFLDEDCDTLSISESLRYEIIWLWEERKSEEPAGRYNFEIINEQYEKSSVVNGSPGCCRSNIQVILVR